MEVGTYVGTQFVELFSVKSKIELFSSKSNVFSSGFLCCRSGG